MKLLECRRPASALLRLAALALMNPIAAGPSLAAEPSAPASNSTLQRPAEMNGYQDIILAGEVLRTSKLFQQADQFLPAGGAQRPTLALKRRALADRPVIRALALLRQALAKPVFAPRSPAVDASTFTDFGLFRSLGRLLRMQQYVLLADGRVPEAIASFRLGLRLGRVVQTYTAVAALVGSAITNLSLSTLGAHLDQLSARDCELLYDVCQEWLRQPSPLPGVLEGERQFVKRNMAEMRRKGTADMEEDADAPAEDQAIAPEIKRLRSSPEALERMLLEAEQQVDAYFDRQIAELKKPAWQRSRPEIPKTSLAARYADMIVSALAGMGDIDARQEAGVRLLACHAAIRRYRWEHETLPAGLSVLNLGDLAIDPFTGQLLKYERRGSGYRLTSAGPMAGADDPRAVDGRRPISIVPEEP